MKRFFIIVTVAVILGLSPMAASGVRAQDDESVVSGTLIKLDLDTLRGLLTTDLGRPVFFDIPKAYLFENVTQGARITLQLDEQGGAVKVMDTSIADFVPAVISTSHVAPQPLAATLPEAPSPIDSPQ